MTTRNKILLSVGAVCLVAVIAVVAVVAVFAARTQTVNSTITVSYSARQVVGTVSANYYLGGNSQANAMKSGAKTELEFKAGETQRTDTLAPEGDIKLDDLPEDKLYVVFEYKFTNTGNQDYTAKLTYNGTATNVAVYVYNPEESGTLNTTTWTSATGTLKTISGETTLFDSSEITVAKTEGVENVYVIVNITSTNSGSDAEFKGTFNWTLEAVSAAAAA